MAEYFLPLLLPFCVNVNVNAYALQCPWSLHAFIPVSRTFLFFLIRLCLVLSFFLLFYVSLPTPDLLFPSVLSIFSRLMFWVLYPGLF